MKKFNTLFEKKKLDPVGKADADIDNDGDVDSSDEYLHKRRKAIKKSIKKESDDEMTVCPECGGSTENHDPECSKYKSAEKTKMNREAKDLETSNADKALKHDCASHVTSEKWGYGECIPGQHTLEETVEGQAVVTHYDVMFEHGIEFNVPLSELKVIKSANHMHSKKKKESAEVEEGVSSAIKVAKKSGGQMTKAYKKIDKMKKGLADNPRVQKALAKANEEEDVKEDVNEGYESVQEVEQEVETTYSNFIEATRAALMQMWENDRSKHYKGATEPESEKDKRKGKGAEDMAADLKADNPDVNDDDEKGHDDASKAGRVTKKSPVRNGDNQKGDTKIVNPVKGA